MIVVGRRVLRLQDPPGATVTIGPWTLEELLAWGDLRDDIDALQEIFVSHIEAHPFAVADVHELDAIALEPIVRAWTAAIHAPPLLRGARH